MSRGAGHIQRTILVLIETDADGAWTLGQICHHVYAGINRIEKKHRVAVARALRKMTLPEPWDVRAIWVPGAEHCLYNPCSLISTASVDWFAYCDWGRRCGWPASSIKSLAKFIEDRPDDYRPGDRFNACVRVERAKRWRDATEIERAEMDIQAAEETAALCTSLGAKETVASQVARIAELREKLAQLKAEQAA